jgi:hypothetical protein
MFIEEVGVLEKRLQWFDDNCEHLRFSISWHNPQARYHLIPALQSQGYSVGLIAARLLEHLGSVFS